MFDGVPDGADLNAAHALLALLPGVDRVHDLPVWAMGISEIALSAQVVMPQGHAGDALLKHAAEQLLQRFGVERVAMQVAMQVARVPFTRARVELAPCGAARPAVHLPPGPPAAHGAPPGAPRRAR